MTSAFAVHTPAAPPAIQPQGTGRDTNRPPLVLIVDDDPDFLLQHETHFQALGFEVATADREDAARELLDQRQPDLAVVDLMMQQPDSGFTLCHEMKRRYPDLPVIMVTSAGSITGYDFSSLSSAQRNWIRADAVLAKPIRFDQLQREVNRLLQE
jgi:two-component system, OmpR family, response regulator